MDAFEKWRQEYRDRMHAEGRVVPDRHPTEEECFRAGMRAAAEINERARLEVETNLSRGKGTWPQADYIRDETWANWRGQEQALRWARYAILAEADK